MKQRGFTLVEVMVVVAILAVLASLATVSARPRTTAFDVGHQLRALVDKASREAVRRGPLRPDVAMALGSRARTQVIASSSGGVTAFYVQRLVEDAAPATSATWETLDAFSLPSWVAASAFARQATTYSATTPLTDWSTFSIACFPDGTCERQTVFFETATGPTSTRKARVVVLPAAAPHVFSGWN